MHADRNGRRLWFDVDGEALVPEAPALRERPWKDGPERYRPLVVEFLCSR